MQRTDAAGGVTVIVDALLRHLHERRPEWRVERVVQRSQAASSALKGAPRWRRAFADVAAGGRLASAILRSRPDLVVGFTPAFAAAGGWLARRYGGRAVLTHHLQRDAIGRTASWLVGVGERRGWFDATVACSAAVAADFPEARRMEVVVNGVPDVRRAADAGVDRGWLAARHGVPGDLRLAFAAGRLAPAKGHAVVIEALVRAPGWRLAVAGAGPSRDELLAYAGSLGVAERVHLVGRLEGPVAWALMGVADAYVQPSRAEGLSLALIEACAMGAAVLASAIPPNREVVEPTAAGLLLDGDDSAAWARAFARLESEPELGPRLRQRARAAFEERFDQRRMLEGYERVLARSLEAA